MPVLHRRKTLYFYRTGEENSQYNAACTTEEVPASLQPTDSTGLRLLHSHKHSVLEAAEATRVYIAVAQLADLFALVLHQKITYLGLFFQRTLREWTALVFG